MGGSGSRYRLRRPDHTKVKVGTVNNVDPDDGNRWVCNACRLPIFSTPFVAGDADDPNPNTLMMHIQCADQLPAKIEDHPLHPSKDLTLFVDDTVKIVKINCSRCGSMCGSKFYACGKDSCSVTFDLTCALSIKIAHRSHPHRLTATKGRSCFFICRACGVQHPPQLGSELETWDLFYVCSICDFWIHPDCALLPNVIVVDNKYHSHPLLLSYAYQNILKHSSSTIVCAICEGKSKGIGRYECLHCGYSAHVKCVLHSDPLPRPVLLRDAKIPGLLRLPMPDEHQNLMALIMNTYQDTPSTATDGASTSTSTSTTRVDGDSEDTNVHEHPLIFHDRLHNDGHDIAAARVCNACVRLVSLSDSFYSCHEASCRDFILHECCAHLPSTLINQTLSHMHKDYTSLGEHQCPLSLKSKPITGYDPVLIFNLKHGMLQCNGFLYSCSNGCGFYLDIVSALMPVSITHDAHSKSHILRKQTRRTADITCSFCGMLIYSSLEINYECNNGCDFFVHAECAILPDTVSHDFDPHPLKLMTYNPRQPQEEEEIPFCEICEKDIGNRGCYYGCSTCKQTFHTDCFPYLDRLSKMKLGFTVGVTCHGCPLTCVRAHPLIGHKCDHCKLAITESDQVAFECTDCYFRMHKKCAMIFVSKC